MNKFCGNNSTTPIPIFYDHDTHIHTILYSLSIFLSPSKVIIKPKNIYKFTAVKIGNKCRFKISSKFSSLFEVLSMDY